MRGVQRARRRHHWWSLTCRARCRRRAGDCSRGVHHRDRRARRNSPRAQIFPYLGVVPLYRRLAETCRVTYYSVYSDRPSREMIDYWSDKEEGEAAACTETACTTRGRNGA